MFRTSMLLGAVALVCSIAVTTASAGMIGVNYMNNSANETLAPADLAGAPGYEQANWNNVGRWGKAVSLNSDSGAPANVTTTWDSNNTWETGTATDTPNGKLMKGYIDALGMPNDNTSVPYDFWSTRANQPQVYVTGLSQWLAAQAMTTYSVVVYTDGDVAEGRKSEYWLQAVVAGDPPSQLGADLTSHVFVSDTSNFDGVFTQVPLSANTVDNAGAGNFFVFTGLTSDNFLLRTEEQTFRATINAIQIIATPEPASLSLLAFSALALASRRRKA